MMIWIDRNQRKIQAVLAELESISSQINLKLPASPIAIQRQFSKISLAQQRLEWLENELAEFSGMRRQTALWQTHVLLTGLVDYMAQEAETLKLLAEEFPVDPAGTVACLQEMHRRNMAVIQQINALKTTESQPKPRRLIFKPA